MANTPFDPEHLATDALGGEPALHPERLTPAWLRHRFANPPAWQAEAPEVPQAALLRRATVTPASVLIPLVERPLGLSLLLTRRTAHLTDHGGQISFPGGRAESWDASPVATALRETEEEIGLAARHVDVIGSLPDYATITGYRVTPVVGLIAPPFTLQPDPNEVAAVFEVPLAFLMDGMHHRRLSVALPDGAGRRSFYAMPYQEFFIWGATAGMLRNLFHFLRA